MAEPLYAAGTRVKYWGQAKGSKYYGGTAVIVWANQCGCKHQTYCIELWPDGVRLEQVLETNLTPVETA